MAGAEARWSANNGYIIFGTLARPSLLSEGENPKVVSERLGHASITLTLDVLAIKAQTGTENSGEVCGIQTREPYYGWEKQPRPHATT